MKVYEATLRSMKLHEVFGAFKEAIIASSRQVGLHYISFGYKSRGIHHTCKTFSDRNDAKPLPHVHLVSCKAVTVHVLLQPVG